MNSKDFRHESSLVYIKSIESLGFLKNIDYSDLEDALRGTDQSELDAFFDCIETHISSHSVEARLLEEVGLFEYNSKPDVYEVDAIDMGKLSIVINKCVVELESVDIYRDEVVCIDSYKDMHSAVLGFKKHLYNFIDEIISMPKSQVIFAIDDLEDFLEKEEYFDVFITSNSLLDLFTVKASSDCKSSKSLIILDDEFKQARTYPFSFVICGNNGNIRKYVKSYEDLYSVLLLELINVVSNS